MVRNLLIVFVLLLAANMAVFAQSGELKGKVLDKVTKEPIPFANIIVDNKGTQAGGAASDIDGRYTIKPITPGTYDVKASFLGYKAVMITGIPIRAGIIEYLNIELESTAIQMTGVVITKYKVPLIDKDKTMSGATVTSEEISKMPSRNVNSVATSVGGVFSRDGELGSMRGQRSDGNVMYIDGIRVRGSSSLPESAIEQVSVILGGVPAMFGDATGGIINVTTKGPSRTFGGGLEIQTSELLDNYGYNRAGVNLTGPIFKNKEKTSSILGYFMAADVEYKKDGSPLALGRYKVKDDVLAELEKNPLRFSGNGVYNLSSEYIHLSDLQPLKSTLNSNEYNVNTSLKLDVKSGKNTTLAFGGSYNANHTLNYSWLSSIFNYDRNSLSTGDTWRVFGRFTQRFPADKESNNVIKNVYYSIQADYTKINAKTQDAQLKDNLMGYGYIGKFTTHKVKAYDYTGTVDTTGAVHFFAKMNGYADTLITYQRAELNPIMANYTTNYYDYYASTPAGHLDKAENIALGGGLLNGYTPNAVYGIWGSPGSPQAGYGVVDQQQATATLNIAGDVGNHELKLGFTFERYSSRGYNLNPTAFWTNMYQLANSHIAQLDLNNPINYTAPFDTTTIAVTDYHRLYDGASQRAFDKSLRSLMGLPVNGTDWIDINSYDINSQTINYYDENNVLNTVNLSKPLSVDLFSPDELLNNTANANNQYGNSRGYDYHGNRLSSKPSIEDFFQKKDANGNYTREIAPFEPIYMAGYIQDKFSFDDLVFNIGLRVDRFDANQSVLKDPESLYPTKTVSEVKDLGTIPSTMGPDYVVYVDNVVSPTRIMGYRSGSNWYDANGAVVVDDPRLHLNAGNGISPYLVDPSSKEITAKSFADYKPQITVMPRISFSFPISDEALFYAHYDVLTQRPTTGFASNPVQYLFWANAAGQTMSNPNLKPEKTVDYELGFQQKLSNSSSLNISGFYREFRDQIQQVPHLGAYPNTYYSYGNIDFGTVKGLTASYDLRRTTNIRVRASYTLQFANGTGSNAETAAGLLHSGRGNIRVLLPYDYDQRHAFNLNVDFRYSEGTDYNGPIIMGKQILKNAGFNLTLKGGSGTPYTRSDLVSPLSAQTRVLGSVNGSRLPSSFRMDARFDKDFTIATKKDANGKSKEYFLNVYLQVLNVMNAQNIMGVYAYTGNPDDDGYMATSQGQALLKQQVDSQSYSDLYSIRVNNPYNYSSPRMIRLGLGFNF